VVAPSIKKGARERRLESELYMVDAMLLAAATVPGLLGPRRTLGHRTG
jgi:hypothetical protein